MSIFPDGGPFPRNKPTVNFQSELTVATSYDTVGRVTKVIPPDGTATSNNVTTSYYQNGTTITDQAGKQRKIYTDSLGRIRQVYEPDSGGNLTVLTDNNWNALDNLVSVIQATQTRSFAYDSLSRLTSTTNPESGTITYTYDNDGNLTQKQAPKPNQTNPAVKVNTTYSYAALYRLTSKSYDDGTPRACLYYDEATVTIGSWSSPTLAYPKGRQTHNLTSTGTSCTSPTATTATVSSYDQLGRVKDYWQCTPYNCGSATIWRITYNYNLAGGNTSYVNPANFTVTNIVNTAQRLTSISTNVTGQSLGVVASITYTPWGAIKTLLDDCAGAGCTQRRETYDYNKRLQPVRIQLGTAADNDANSCLVYNLYSATAPSSCAVPTPGTSNNNGNLLSYFLQETASPSLQHKGSYTYDALNRLATSSATAVAPGTVSHSLTYAYDRWGNADCNSGANPIGLCPDWSFNTATNRINSANFTYDAAGNMTQDDTLHTYQWDGEGRLKSVDNGSTLAVTYNGLGRRVDNLAPTFREALLYHADGQELANFNALNGTWWSQYISFGGRPLGKYFSTTGTYFFHYDRLGSGMEVTKHDGGFQQANKDTLSFTGGNAGNVLYHGTFIGTFNQTSVDADPAGLSAVGLGTRMAEPGVNLAANGLRAFGYVVAAPMMVAAECAAGALSCTGGNVALAVVPELGPILGVARLAKAERGLHAAQIFEKAGGVTQATKDFEALQGATKTLGNVKVKALADGSKAVLRGGKEGRSTLEIQHAGGARTKIRYNP